MLKFIDISNWQGDINLSPMPIDAVIIKATEGTGFVDKYCDKNVQKAKAKGIPYGFYHFAGTHGAIEEADFFIRNCKNYFKDGIPVLDWEGNQGVSWVNQFVNYVYKTTGVWCWIYANPWRFNQGGVEKNCMRWVASYPSVTSPSFNMATQWEPPATEGGVGAWQFCSDGHLSGYSGNLDCNLFYGDLEAWGKYANPAKATKPSTPATNTTPTEPNHETTDTNKTPKVYECEHFRIEIKSNSTIDN